MYNAAVYQMTMIALIMTISHEYPLQDWMNKLLKAWRVRAVVAEQLVHLKLDLLDLWQMLIVGSEASLS